MKVTYSCYCCLIGTSDKALTTPHTRLGVTEIYSNMLEECFQIHLKLDNDQKFGICLVCVGRLRDASDFKLQVQRSQAELRAWLGPPQVKDEDPLFLPETTVGGACSESLSHEMIYKSGGGVLEGEADVKLEIVEEDETEDKMLREELPVKAEPVADASDEESLSQNDATVKLEMFEEDGTADEMLREELPVKAEPPALASQEFVSLASSDGGKAALLAGSVGLQRLRGDATCTYQICHKKNEQESSLATHFAESIEVHAEEKAYTQERTATAYACVICSKSFSRKNCLTNHARTHNEEKVDEKLYNKNNCTEKNGLIIDDQVRKRDDGYIRDVRNKRSILRNVKRRTKTHTKRKVFNCKICNRSFARNCNMIRHVKTHTGLKPYSCDICNKQYSRSEALKLHARLHTDIIDTESKQHKRTLHKCDTCNKLFTLKRSLQVHVRIHTGEKPYNCDVCNKSFTQKSSLIMHVRTHTGQKPYSCDICNKKFRVIGTLRSHVGVHTGQKLYCCHVCSRLFRREDNLKRHIKIHTGQKLYTCHMCNKQFIQKSNLKYHIVHAGHILA